MLRTKDATSKKRKLSEVDQKEDVFPPRKSRILPNISVNDTHPATLDAAFESQRTAVNDGSRARTRLKGEDNKPGQDAARPENERDFLRGPDTVNDAKDEEATGPTPQSEGKDKAALRQAKSERRSKKKRKPDVADTPPTTETVTAFEQTVSATDDQKQDENEAHVLQPSSSDHQSKPDSKQRFIVFIGNLPYTATTQTIQSHFSKLQPFTVRHSTNKETGRSRGFAFLEFEGYDKMKTCLKLFHRSLFEASSDQLHAGMGKGKRSQARKINVELTAGGGGGKSAARKERIKGKNEKLEGERERARVHREREEAAAIRKKKRNAGGMTGANAIQVTNGDAEDENIHPSRRKRMET